MIRFQLAVLYLGADLNKVFDPDWWTGASMETLLVTKHQIASYMKVASMLSRGFLSQIVGIGVIVLQITIAMLLLRRGAVIYAMLLALALHLPMVLLMQMTFGPFLFALITAYGSLLSWPRRLACDSRLHSSELVKWLGRMDFNEQISPCAGNAKESPVRWLRTCLHYLAHPAILLSMTILTAVLVRYGKLIPLALLAIAAYRIYAWPQRNRVSRPSPVASL